MIKYYQIATAQARPLQYKNCYNWELVAELEDGTCYYIFQSTIVKSNRNDVLDTHKRVTAQKPYAIKKAEKWLLWGGNFALLKYAIENNLETQHYNFSDEKWQTVLKNAPKFREA